MIATSLMGTGRFLPGRAVTNEDLAAITPEKFTADYITKRSGIHTRYWSDKNMRHADIGLPALVDALEMAEVEPTDLKRLIFTSTAGGDYLTPSTASQIADRLGLSGSCDCFDISNACTGFLTCTDIAARSVATGLGPVAVVAVEKYSDINTAESPRPLVIFGDAGAAAVYGPSTNGAGILGSSLRTDPRPGLTAYIEHPRWTGRSQPTRFGVPSQAMTEGVIRFLADACQEALTQANLEMESIDWVLPHQPNGFMFEQVLKGLNVPRAKTLKIVHEVGSIGCVSVPFSLDTLIRSGLLKPGQTVLMTAIGAGVGFGATILRMP